MDLSNIQALFEKVKSQKPLVHHITNPVTVNDCANVTLAIGGSPVMADCYKEVEEMVALASALMINFGTITDDSLKAMKLAVSKANELRIPVVFDPVGVGATNYRTENAKALLAELKIDIIRGNQSEIAALTGTEVNTRGVDAGDVAEEAHITAIKAAEKFQAVVVVTGKTDVVTDGRACVLIENGHEWLTRLTGTGCSSGSLIASFAGVTENLLEAAAAGISTMGICGERAKRQLAETDSLGTFKVKLMDEISLIDDETWIKEVKIREFEA